MLWVHLAFVVFWFGIFIIVVSLKNCNGGIVSQQLSLLLNRKLVNFVTKSRPWNAVKNSRTSRAQFPTENILQCIVQLFFSIRAPTWNCWYSRLGPKTKTIKQIERKDFKSFTRNLIKSTRLSVERRKCELTDLTQFWFDLQKRIRKQQVNRFYCFRKSEGIVAKRQRTLLLLNGDSLIFYKCKRKEQTKFIGLRQSRRWRLAES